MSNITDGTQVFNRVNQSTPVSAIVNLANADVLSVGITVSAATGSNVLSLSESVDGINFAEVATLTITAPGTTIWHVYPIFSKFKKILYTPGSGAASFTVTLNVHNHSIPSTGDVTPIVLGVS